MRIVTGTFHDEKKAARALGQLVDSSIPIEDIRIVVRDRDGEHEVPLEERARGGRGSLIGATVGAVLGAVVASLIATGVIPAFGLGLSSDHAWFGILRFVLVGLALGGGFGFLFGLAFWKERADLNTVNLKDGEASIAVRGDDLHQKAKEIFERTGADDISE